MRSTNSPYQMIITGYLENSRKQMCFIFRWKLCHYSCVYNNLQNFSFAFSKSRTHNITNNRYTWLQHIKLFLSTEKNIERLAFWELYCSIGNMMWMSSSHRSYFTSFSRSSVTQSSLVFIVPTSIKMILFMYDLIMITSYRIPSTKPLSPITCLLRGIFPTYSLHWNKTALCRAYTKSVF